MGQAAKAHPEIVGAAHPGPVCLHSAMLTSVVSTQA